MGNLARHPRATAEQNIEETYAYVSNRKNKFAVYDIVHEVVEACLRGDVSTEQYAACWSESSHSTAQTLVPLRAVLRPARKRITYNPSI